MDKTTHNSSFGKWHHLQLKNASVLVIGIGSLGNAVVPSLCSMGVGNLIIVDFDIVETGNIFKSGLFSYKDVGKPKVEVAARRIKEWYPNINVIAIRDNVQCGVGKTTFENVNVVISCVDSFLTRLEINDICASMGTPWVNGGIDQDRGEVSVYGSGFPCMRCGYHKLTLKDSINQVSNGEKTLARSKNTRNDSPTTPIMAPIVGASMVAEALKIIHEERELSLMGYKIQINLPKMEVLKYEVPRGNKECSCNKKWNRASVVKVEEINHTLSVNQVLILLKKRFGADKMSILLDYPFVAKARLRKKIIPLMLPKPAITDKVLEKKGFKVGDFALIVEEYTIVDDSFPYKKLRLKDIGIPSAHIFSIRYNNNKFLIEIN